MGSYYPNSMCVNLSGSLPAFTTVNLPQGFVVGVQVFYENGNTPVRTFDLTEKMLDRGVNPLMLSVLYNASSPTEFMLASGGRMASFLDDKEHTSFNIRARYDIQEVLWNVDIFVDCNKSLNEGLFTTTFSPLCLFSLSQRKKILIKHHEKKIHKYKHQDLGNSNWIRIEWSLNGIRQQSIEATRLLIN